MCAASLRVCVAQGAGVESRYVCLLCLLPAVPPLYPCVPVPPVPRAAVYGVYHSVRFHVGRRISALALGAQICPSIHPIQFDISVPRKAHTHEAPELEREREHRASRLLTVRAPSALGPSKIGLRTATDWRSARARQGLPF